MEEWMAARGSRIAIWRLQSVAWGVINLSYAMEEAGLYQQITLQMASKAWVVGTDKDNTTGCR
jgi:hypothetical protein